MRLKELIENLDYKHIENLDNCEITGISCNSNKIQPGDLFVAIQGQKQDGHNFVSRAIDKGAKAVVVQQQLRLKIEIPCILVADSQSALACVSAKFFGQPAKQLKVVGITGTNGKTTVSYLLEKILSSAGESCGVIGTVNYRLPGRRRTAVNTTPQADILHSLFKEIISAKSKYAIIEVSSHALKQRRVEGVNFSTAVFTNLSREHLDYHNNLQDYFSAKALLFENLPCVSWAVINTDDAWGRKLLPRTNARLLSYGLRAPAQIRAEDIKLSIQKSEFTLLLPGSRFRVESSLVGIHNVYNILAAAAAAFVQQISPEWIRTGILRCHRVPGRLERIECGQDFLVFVDFAHTADALQAVLRALQTAAAADSGRRIILVFGCGGNRDCAKRPKMGGIAAALADVVIITSDNPRDENPQQIADAILKGMPKRRDDCRVILDRFAAIKEALGLAQKGDIVLIAGKGHETRQIFSAKSIAFDDRKAARKVLETCLPSKKSYMLQAAG